MRSDERLGNISQSQPHMRDCAQRLPYTLTGLTKHNVRVQLLHRRRTVSTSATMKATDSHFGRNLSVEHIARHIDTHFSHELKFILCWHLRGS